MELIRIQEMLTVMDMKSDETGLPIPFAFTFITCDLDKNTGGKRITCANAIMVGGLKSDSTLRNPSHFRNYTRNYAALGNSEIRKFHPLLVEDFNGLKVIL